MDREYCVLDARGAEIALRLMEHGVDQRCHFAFSLSLSVSAVAFNPEDVKPAQMQRNTRMLHFSIFVDPVEFLQSGNGPAYCSWQRSLGNLVAQGLGLPRPKQRVARCIQVQLRVSLSRIGHSRLSVAFMVAGWLHCLQ